MVGTDADAFLPDLVSSGDLVSIGDLFGVGHFAGTPCLFLGAIWHVPAPWH
jgi:hypothetical protein